MSGLSEDDSSDSSNEFLVNPEKLNLNFSIFNKKESNVKVPAPKSTTSEDSSEDDFHDVTQETNAELFTRVLQNLENAQKLNVSDDNTDKLESGLTEKRPKIDVPKTVSAHEINELLLQGETGVSFDREDEEEASDNAEENVAESAGYTVPKDGVTITLPGTSILLKKKKKGGTDVKAALRRQLKAHFILIEKVGLLCWLAYGFHLNQHVNDSEVMSMALSLMSMANYPKGRADLTYLEQFTKWFKSTFVVEANAKHSIINRETLLQRLGTKKILDYRELVLLYIATLRAIGLNCRLVVSLCPPRLKLPPELLGKEATNQAKGKPNESGGRKRKASKDEVNSSKEASGKAEPIKNSAEAKKSANEEAKKKAAEIMQKSQERKNITRSQLQADKANKGKKVLSYTENKPNPSGTRQLRSRQTVTGNTNPEETGEQKSKSIIAKRDGTRSKYYKKDDETDSEEEFEPPQKRAPTKRKIADVKPETAAVSRTQGKNRKLVSTDSEDDTAARTRNSEEIWAEVYLESEESWVCVSVTEGKVHCVAEVYKKARRPVLYVVAWNTQNKIKDLTRRYCPHWLTKTRKQRIDEKWWLESLSHWKESDTAISKEEDEMLLKSELEQPLPKTVGECKGHPLYVLCRHLLKYEALYPPDCVPLGYLKTKEAIYSRYCVHILRSRETWIRQARVVKPKQDAYKVVKSLPKYDKLSGQKIKDSPLELFGEWQTTEYIPPEAKDGKVPRNEYGNVDMYKACMLPKGTVHIKLPGLNRVARKLDIDCAPAVVGFNFGCMGAVPDIDGYIVCSEFEDTLREAWEAEQVAAAKRTKEKRDQRIYGNWKKLIRGLIIRERLAKKYEFMGTKNTSAEGSKRAKHKNREVKKPKVS